jgi:hypothetical protein
MWSLKTSGMKALAGYWALENPVARPAEASIPGPFGFAGLSSGVNDVIIRS